MKKRWMMFGILGVLAVGSFTVYASERTAAKAKTERSFSYRSEVEATTEKETEAEPVICTEATSEDFVEATTKATMEDFVEATTEATPENMPETEIPAAEVTPEMRICREFLGKYFTVDLDAAKKTLWILVGAASEDSRKAVEDYISRQTVSGQEGMILSLSETEAPALAAVVDEIWEEYFSDFSEDLKSELLANRSLTRFLRFAVEKESDLVILSQTLDHESQKEDGETSFSFHVTIQAGDQEETVDGTIVVTPNEEGKLMITNFYIR